MVSSLLQSWWGGAFVNNDSTHFYYHTVSASVASVDNQQFNLSSFPNPCTSEFTLTGTNESGEVFLFDALGNEVLRTKSNSNETKVNTGSISPGFYHLRYTESNRSSSLKIVRY